MEIFFAELLNKSHTQVTQTAKLKMTHKFFLSSTISGSSFLFSPTVVSEIFFPCGNMKRSSDQTNEVLHDAKKPKKDGSKMKRSAGELPRLYPKTYSTCDRPRRVKDGEACVPERFRGKIYFCQEYPGGIYIDKNKIPQPTSSKTNRVAVDAFGDDSDSTSSDESYEPSSASENEEDKESTENEESIDQHNECDQQDQQDNDKVDCDKTESSLTVSLPDAMTKDHDGDKSNKADTNEDTDNEDMVPSPNRITKSIKLPAPKLDLLPDEATLIESQNDVNTSLPVLEPILDATSEPSVNDLLVGAGW